MQKLKQEALHAQETACMWCRYSGIAFMIAAILLCASQHIAMIVVGRILQGIAVSTF